MVLAGAMPYFWVKVYFKRWRAPGNLLLPNQFQKWSNSVPLIDQKMICYGLKKVVAKSRARVYFEQQILALLLVFHQTDNLSRNKFARALANQPISALHFFKPQQMFLLRVTLFTPGEKHEHRPKLARKQCCATS